MFHHVPQFYDLIMISVFALMKLADTKVLYKKRKSGFFVIRPLSVNIFVKLLKEKYRHIRGVFEK